MLRLLTIIALVVTVLFAAGSCTTKRITATGAKHSSYTKFNFRLRNDHPTRASIYKRYVAHNRNFRELPSGNRKPRPATTTNKRLLAQND